MDLSKYTVNSIKKEKNQIELKNLQNQFSKRIISRPKILKFTQIKNLMKRLNMKERQ